jgi:hypothetical protein
MKGYTVKKSGFTFQANHNDFSAFDHTGWARTKGYFDGIDVMFHGSPDELYEAGDGRDGTCRKIVVEGTDPRTGVSGIRNIYYPKSYWEAVSGSSYAVAAANSGIGLFLQMGKDESNVPHFLQRKRVYGGSPDLMEVYNHFEIAPDECLPFTGPNKIMDVRSGQQINTLVLPEGTKFQQKMGFTLQRTDDPSIRVEYSCNTGMSTAMPHGRIWSDPNQSGHTVISGQLGGKNVDTPMKDGEFSIWTSRANETVSGIASSRPFRFEVTFAQFIDSLNYAARRDLAEIDMFGEGWSIPENWQLKIAKYGYEFYNPEDLNAEIGGMMRYFSIKAR